MIAKRKIRLKYFIGIIVVTLFFIIIIGFLYKKTTRDLRRINIEVSNNSTVDYCIFAYPLDIEKVGKRDIPYFQNKNIFINKSSKQESMLSLYFDKYPNFKTTIICVVGWKINSTNQYQKIYNNFNRPDFTSYFYKPYFDLHQDSADSYIFGNVNVDTSGNISFEN